MAAPRIGIFGGTFDPPHVAHLAIAEAAREQARLDRVLFVPASASPFKRQRGTAPATDRLAMARLATAGNPFFDVSDVEVVRGGTSYTIDTLRALHEDLPGAELRLIIGGDQLADFPRWREPEEIARLAPLVVYRRRGFEAPQPAEHPWLGERVTFVDAAMIELSATEIRGLIGRGRSVRYLVPENVRAYITDRRLYRQPGPTEPPELLAS